MYAIIGIRNSIYQERIGEPFEDHREEETVALFHNRRDAEKYIAGARLKNPRFERFYGWHTFRKNTLLGSYEDAFVSGYDEPNYPIDPELP